MASVGSNILPAKVTGTVIAGLMPAPGLQSQFCAHIVSLWGIGVGLLHHIRASEPEQRRALIEERLKAGLRRLPL